MKAEARELVDVLVLYAISKKTGEPFHPHYRANRKHFKRLLRAEARLLRAVRRRLKRQRARLAFGVRWDLIQDAIDNRELLQPVKKAWWDNTDFLNSWAIWDEDPDDDLLAAFTESVMTGWSVRRRGVRDAAADWAEEYAASLVKGIDDTTRSRLNSRVARGIGEGLSVEQIAGTLTSLFEDRRAFTIAQTEVIRAYTHGLIESGRQTGATRKLWLDGQDGACERCLTLDRNIVQLDELFVDQLKGEAVHGPPLHPHCRCGLALLDDDDNPDLIE